MFVPITEQTLKMSSVIGAGAGQQVPLLQKGVDGVEVLVIRLRGLQEFLRRDLKMYFTLRWVKTVPDNASEFLCSGEEVTFPF